MELIDGWRPDALWVPVSYAEARIYAPLPARIISHVQNAATNRGSGPTAVFDVTLATPDGRVVAAFRGLTLRKLDQALTLPGPDARAMIFDDGAAPTSPAEAQLRATLAQGIRPAEGAEAFLRALAMPGPQVFVSSLPLPDLVAAAERLREDYELAQMGRAGRPWDPQAATAPGATNRPCENCVKAFAGTVRTWTPCSPARAGAARRTRRAAAGRTWANRP